MTEASTGLMRRGSGMKTTHSSGMNRGCKHQAVTKSSRSSSTGTSLGRTTSTSAQAEPRITYAVAALREWRGMRRIPTSTLKAEGACTCHRRPAPGAPKQETPPGRCKDAVAVDAVLEPNHKVLRVMAADVRILSPDAKMLKQEAGHHGRRYRGPGTTDQRDERKTKCVFSRLELRRTWDDNEVGAALSWHKVSLRSWSGHASNHGTGGRQCGDDGGDGGGGVGGAQHQGTDGDWPVEADRAEGVLPAEPWLRRPAVERLRVTMRPPTSVVGNVRVWPPNGCAGSEQALVRCPSHQQLKHLDGEW